MRSSATHVSQKITNRHDSICMPVLWSFLSHQCASRHALEKSLPDQSDVICMRPQDSCIYEYWPDNTIDGALMVQLTQTFSGGTQ